MRVYLWQNCRELCLAIVKRFDDNGTPMSKIAVFGEVRNTDGIFVDSWEQVGSLYEEEVTHNNPNYEEAYQNRQYFGFGRVDLAVECILNFLGE